MTNEMLDKYLKSQPFTADFLKLYRKEMDDTMNFGDNLKPNDKNYNNDLEYFSGKLEILLKFYRIVSKVEAEINKIHLKNS